MDACITCKLITRRDKGQAPLWDSIWRTAHWDIVHALDTSLPGWIVLVARRHVASIDQLEPAEAGELGEFIQSVSAALRTLVGCEKTYVMQFAEAPGHGHVHFHIVPRMADLPDYYKGARIFNYLGVSEEERLSDDVMNDIGLRLRNLLTG